MTVDLVYQGKIDTETVIVQTDRNKVACSLGALAVGTEYMFFVTGTGDPWVAGGTSGTRISNETVVARWCACSARGSRRPCRPPSPRSSRR